MISRSTAISVLRTALSLRCTYAGVARGATAGSIGRRHEVAGRSGRSRTASRGRGRDIGGTTTGAEDALAARSAVVSGGSAISVLGTARAFGEADT